jgi:uncharacterized protein
MQAFIPTERTQLRRHPERGVYDLEQIYAILDEGYICHLGFSINGQTYVVPTAYGRFGNQIYLHGSAASRTLRSLAQAIDVCATVTLVDGFVLARSAFRHSINYRSVVVLGQARLVRDGAEKMEALRTITNHLAPRRWEQVRPPNRTEMMQTSVLSLPLNEVSAKMRSGPPLDLEDDYPIPVWAGVVPVRTQVGAPIADHDLLAGISEIDPRTFERSRHAQRIPPRLAILRVP